MELVDFELVLVVRCVFWFLFIGIIDSYGFMFVFQGGLEVVGGQVVFNIEVDCVELCVDGYWVYVCMVEDEIYVFICKELILLVGYVVLGFVMGIEQVDLLCFYFVKGNYFKLQGKVLFLMLIYLVLELGGLGVYLILDLQYQVWFGLDVEWVEDFDYCVDFVCGDNFYVVICSYWLDLLDDVLILDYFGICFKIVGKGEVVVDFCIDGFEVYGWDGFVVFYGIEFFGFIVFFVIVDEVVIWIG